MQGNLRSMRPTPGDPVRFIPERDLQPNPVIDPDRVRSALEGMDGESASGPDRAGTRWPLLVATNDMRAHPDFSGLQILGLVVQTIAAGKLSAHVSHLLSVANLIPLDKGKLEYGPLPSTSYFAVWKRKCSCPMQ